MKTIKIYLASLLLFTLLVTGLNAKTLAAATGIDIPPTSCNEYTDTTPDYDFLDESYINDIPFDTECVSKDCVYEKAISEAFNLPEEAYIKDISFNTAKVAKQQQFQNTSQSDFQFEDENYIDDIPFNTYRVASEKNNLIISMQYAK